MANSVESVPRFQVECVTRFQKAALALLAAGVISITAIGALNMIHRGEAPSGAGSHGTTTSDASDGAAASAALAKPVRVVVVSVSSAGKLSDLFRKVGYELPAVRQKGEVPRLLLSSLPGDLGKLQQPSKRKVMFIKTMLPLVLHVNEDILKQRDRIKALHDKTAHGGKLTAGEKAWLDKVADDYGVDSPDYKTLLRHVDIVPPSLAIAQAAEESGWGTSRFAREGNALFGQRVYRSKHDGLVPKDRADGKKFKVRAFDQLLDAVKAYAHNLNSHFAYGKFRKARAGMRADSGEIEGYQLIATLDKYSERGDAYVRTIRTIIRANQLGMFDRSWLREVDVDEDGPDA